MTDERRAERLGVLLEEHAASFAPGPAPLALLAAAERDRRRRRTRRFALAAGGVLAACALPLALLRGPADTAPPPDRPGVEIAEQPGTRLYGVGPVLVQVPSDWAVNAQRCGQAQADTVVVGVQLTSFCLAPRAVDVESLTLERGRPATLGPTRSRRIDGVPVQVEEVTCQRAPVLCSARAWFPDQDVTVTAESSTDAAKVEVILAMVRVASNLVGVPATHEGTPAMLPMPVPGQGSAAPLQAYLTRLGELGLRARVEPSPRGHRPLDVGRLEETHPRAGTVVPRGSEVVVTVTPRPDGSLPD